MLVGQILDPGDQHRTGDPAGGGYDGSRDIPAPATQASRQVGRPRTGGSPAHRRLGVGTELRHLRDGAESEVLRYGLGKPRSFGTARRVDANRPLDPNVTPDAREPWP